MGAFRRLASGGRDRQTTAPIPLIELAEISIDQRDRVCESRPSRRAGKTAKQCLRTDAHGLERPQAGELHLVVKTDSELVRVALDEYMTEHLQRR